MANNSFKEMGRLGQKRYGGFFYEEFLKELQGKKGVEVFREMSENDDVIGSILYAIEMLIRQATWNVQPAGSTPGRRSSGIHIPMHGRHAGHMDRHYIGNLVLFDVRMERP